MDEYLVTGGRPLQGEIRLHGAKNSVLPILAGALLGGETILHNCPRLTDVDAACNILEYLGQEVAREGQTVVIRPGTGGDYRIPDRLMSEMRSSIVFLGAVIARFGRAVVSMPGGCELGPRPIDIHLDCLRRMGVEIREEHGHLDCRVKGRLRGARLTLPFPSVGATENVMLAAVTAQGETSIHNAAREPEIVDLADFLVSCGARVRIAPEGTVVIQGVEKLHGAEHQVIPDRIAAATYLCAAAITGGRVRLTQVRPDHLTAVLPAFEEAGCRVRTGEGEILLEAPPRLERVRMVRTMPYPGFSTDAQSPLMAVTCLARGTSIFVETIFESRYKQVDELARMGARIKVDGRMAVVEGVERLHSAPMNCTDLRGGAALVIAALGAEGTSTIGQIRHIDRGYEDMDLHLRAIGADIVRRKEEIHRTRK